LADVPDKAQVTRSYALADGRTVAIRSLDDSLGIRVWADGDYFPQILVDYLAAGRARLAPVGQGRGELLDGRDFLGFAVDWLETHFAAP
jgi:hypothetical protein